MQDQLETVREAVARLSRVGVRPEIMGSGLVVAQTPPAGSVLGSSPTCLLRCQPAPARDPQRLVRRGD